MDNTYPTFTLKTTSEKFKVLENNNPIIYDSEDDASVSTNPLTDDDCTDSDDQCIGYCDSIECDNSATIKSKPAMLKNELKDLIETQKLPDMVKDSFCDASAEDDQELFNEA